jgi:DNA polymerase-3 subunit alpha
MKTVGGVITSLARKYTKKGELMATFCLEDLEAAIDVWVFPRTMVEYGALLEDDVIVAVKGRLDRREEPNKLVAMEVKRLDLVPSTTAEPVRIRLPLSTLTDTSVDGLKQLLLEHPGDAPVLLELGDKILRLSDQYRVDAGNGLLGEIRVLLGPASVRT